MTELRDPSKGPPGEIVEDLPDGGAIRKDGAELKPAARNRWYVLATVHGEQAGKRTDWGLHAKNRRIWNGWACSTLSDDERAALAERMELPAEELRPLEPEERARLERAFRERLGDGTTIPDPGERIDFSFTYFATTTPAVLEKCVFSGYAVFGSAQFGGDAVFASANFRGLAVFDSATFGGLAVFDSATFSGTAYFNSATFSEEASFNSASFSGAAFFQSATFSGFTVFRSATFNWFAFFDSATFGEFADFRSGAFESATDFRRARFKREVPRFHQRQMYQDTKFTTEAACWPEITGVTARETAEDGKSAYVRLRKIMNDLHQPDAEHFFFRQEMRCEWVLKAGWEKWLVWGFGWLSDFGYGVAKPFVILLGLWLGPALVYAFLLGPGCWAGLGASPPGCGGQVLASLGTGAGFSFANLFGFLGLQRLHFAAGFWTQLPGGLKVLAGLQTVLGFFFLFFLGLGLRNRFRLK